MPRVLISDRVVDAMRLRKRALSTEELATIFERSPSKMLETLAALNRQGKIEEASGTWRLCEPQEWQPAP